MIAAHAGKIPADVLALEKETELLVKAVREYARYLQEAPLGPPVAVQAGTAVVRPTGSAGVSPAVPVGPPP